MPLLAEQLIEEWFHGQGYFTLRGLKLGVHEADLLGVRFADGKAEGIHVEVSISTNPLAYIAPLTPADIKATGARVASSAKRREGDVVARAVAAWIYKKFEHPKKIKAMKQLAPGVPFRRVFVVGKVKYPEEATAIATHGIEVIGFEDVVAAARSAQFKTSGVGADMAAILAFA